MADFLAIDWGTTNRRVYRFSGGSMVATERDGMGVRAVSDFAAEVRGIRHRHGNLPVVMAGMVGSSVGWQEAPYVAAPADIEAIAREVLWIDGRTAIVPGVASRTGTSPDVMRGEEVQFLGAVAAGLAPPDALLVQPGTHCKWAEMQGGRIQRFTTAMTGEMFALLREHSVLAGQLDGAQIRASDDFIRGVGEGARRDLARSLFSVRVKHLLDGVPGARLADFASGIMIGAEVAARLEDFAGDPAHVLADPGMGDLYVGAIRALGRDAVLIDSHAAFVAGISRIGDAIW